MLVILGSTTMLLANKFFSLIHYLPEHVTNWIGQQFHNLGEKEDQASIKGTFSGAASPTANVMRQGMNKAAGSLQKHNDKSAPEDLAGN